MTDAYPLAWPSGWPRTPAMRRKRAKFGTGKREYSQMGGGSWITRQDLTIADATKRVVSELGSLGVRNNLWVISSNLELRNDGLPRRRAIPARNGKPAPPSRSALGGSIEAEGRMSTKKRFCNYDGVIAMRLREVRILSGISQENLGAALGVTFQQVQKMENGSNRISSGRLLQIAEYLGVPVQTFFEGISRDTAEHQQQISDEALKLAREAERLPQECRAVAIRSARAVIEVHRELAF